MRVAVIGSGVAGLVAARLLDGAHEVTLVEADERLGGHVHTIEVDSPEGPLGVDTGFIVFNEPNYPILTGLFEELGVATQPSSMSFSVSDSRNGLEYRPGSLLGSFAQPSRLFSLRFHRMLWEIVRFNREARTLLACGRADDGEMTLLAFVDELGLSQDLRDWFLVPLGAAVWSADPQEFLAFPAVSYARFMNNHHLLGLSGHRQWRTVKGGSARYMEVLLAQFGGRLRSGEPVQAVRRRPEGVELAYASGGTEEFDRVLIATHSDQALGLLEGPTALEREVLGAIGFQPNRVTLHTDSSLMPEAKLAWASWNYRVPREPQGKATLTYWMNRLQLLDSSRDYLVSLNSEERIDPAKVIASFDSGHPVYDLRSVAARGRVPELQGEGGVYFAGAWIGDGFHEDGARSAVEAVRCLEADAGPSPAAEGVAVGL